jgi:hypothetical protein
MSAWDHECVGSVGKCAGHECVGRVGHRFRLIPEKAVRGTELEPGELWEELICSSVPSQPAVTRLGD